MNIEVKCVSDWVKAPCLQKLKDLLGSSELISFNEETGLYTLRSGTITVTPIDSVFKHMELNPLSMPEAAKLTAFQFLGLQGTEAVADLLPKDWTFYNLEKACIIHQDSEGKKSLYLAYPTSLVNFGFLKVEGEILGDLSSIPPEILVFLTIDVLAVKGTTVIGAKVFSAHDTAALCTIGYTEQILKGMIASTIRWERVDLFTRLNCADTNAMVFTFVQEFSNDSAERIFQKKNKLKRKLQEALGLEFKY